MGRIFADFFGGRDCGIFLDFREVVGWNGTADDADGADFRGFFIQMVAVM
jgi:hypothetical protein